MIVAVIILGILATAAIALLVWQNLKPKNNSDSNLLLKADMTELSKRMIALDENMQKQMREQSGITNKQIGAQHAQNMKIVQEVTRQLTGIERTNKGVSDVASELKVLQNVLQNPKQRGVLGEFYLEQALKNMLPTGTYELQYKLGEGLVVDAIIKFGDQLIPVDSKFSLENYNRLIEAKEDDRLPLEKAFKEDLKKRIDETAKYIKPSKGTLDQAFMYIPSEGIYYDLLANKVGSGGVNSRSLLEYANEKKVTIVGPNTLAATLQVIIQGLRSIKINEDTEKIRGSIEQLRKHLMTHGVYMDKLGNSLGATVGHYNTTYKEFGKIDKDIVKITGSEPGVNPKLLDRPNLDENE